MSIEDLRKGFEVHKSKIDKADRINVLLFNTNLFNLEINLDIVFPNKNTVYTALIDFRRFDLISYLEKVYLSGVKAIMFNSYLQRISEADFLLVYKACKYAEEKGMIICIDGSFGTSKMYAYDNLKLSCFICDLIHKTPVVIVHSGGRRILDFMLLALDKDNVWLDTSFSLPFYIGSSAELDFAFAYKKLNCDRIVYGSDYPYNDFDEALKIHLDFFEKHRFSVLHIEQILYLNCKRLFSLD
ncbi:amidohydrolase family protein [Leptospira kanakyensis]|uniref:amidohydrolase family protein n=1 Tax=Leptospira kanakyensis TaxID=2484968 RepID=UPI00223CF3DB|nr:amidohydrolase family protein [Leptospira kanakyensis]MCW7482138.1 amidohydrolase family protein [Leptospira kanakyensis]